MNPISFKKLFSILSGILLGVGLAYAIPAKPGLLEYPMSDGTTLMVTLHGDEYSSYYMSEDGYVLMPGKGGDLYYAALKDGELVCSVVKSTPKGSRPVSEVSFIESLDKSEILATARRVDVEQRAVAHARHKAAETKGVELISSYPTVGSPKALILLVQFKDIKFRTTDPLASFNAMTNERGYSLNGATGSAFDFFYDNSSGLFTPEFQVFGPVTLDNNESYYGEAEGQNYDKQAWKIVTEGCRKLREMHPDLDFSEFDNDGDGFVDNVYVYYAGYGQNSGAESWTIWPHAANVYTYYGANEVYNGVKLGNYACSNELTGTKGSEMQGIGTFCHEFSHILGLPDLYPTNYSGAFTPGSFELMDNGSYNNNGKTPPFMSAYDRLAVGWLKPRELSGPETVTLSSIDNNEALKINTAKADEFFLLENRQLTGWDTYLPGHGMLIWHIDYDPVTWGDNKVNCNTSHQGVDLVEADGILTESTRTGDPFPGTAHVTSFTKNSSPAMSTWTGIDPDMPITDIRESDGLITFKIKGGGERIDPVVATAATDITAVSFRANWIGRPEITTYEVDLCKGLEVSPISTVTVKNATNWLFTGLEPSTDYRYQVRAVDGDLKSVDSNDISVTTADPSFDMLTAVACDPINVYGTEFTAVWQPLENADDYELTVYSKDVVDPKVYKADFSGGLNELVPDQWFTNGNSTDSRSGYFGEARPSLKLANNRDQIQTPVFESDVNYIKFWYRGNGTAETDHIDVEGLLNNAWQTLHIITPINNAAGQIFELGTQNSSVKMPVGVKSVRVIFRKSNLGSMCIDDVEVGAGGSYVPVYVNDYNPFHAGTALSAKVVDLKPSTTYYYVVTGVSSDIKSLPSEEIAVTTASTVAIDSIEMDDDTTVNISIVPDGVIVTNGDTVDHRVSCVTPAGVTFFTGVVKACATEHISLPHNSFFIIKCGGKIAKVLR